MNYRKIMQLIVTTPPKEWISEVDENTSVCGRDLNIRLAAEEEDDEDGPREFHEDWAEDFPDPNAYMVPFVLWYGASPVKKYPMISVDGHRAFLPLPKLNTMEISREQLAVACIVNRITSITDSYFASYIRRFTVVE
jgi:hypothetical protein